MLGAVLEITASWLDQGHIDSSSFMVDHEVRCEIAEYVIQHVVKAEAWASNGPHQFNTATPRTMLYAHKAYTKMMPLDKLPNLNNAECKREGSRKTSDWV